MTPLEIVEKALKEAKIPYYTEEIYYNTGYKTITWLTFEQNFDNEGNQMCIPFDSNGQWLSDNEWRELSNCY